MGWGHGALGVFVGLGLGPWGSSLGWGPGVFVGLGPWGLRRAGALVGVVDVEVVVMGLGRGGSWRGGSYMGYGKGYCRAFDL